MINGADGPTESGAREELTARLKEIDGSIFERHIYGKFDGQVTLHGQPVREASKATFFELLPNDTTMDRLDPTGRFTALDQIVRNGLTDPRFATELQRRFAESHVFGILTDLEHDPASGTMGLIYPVEGEDNAGRPHGTLQVFLKMPKERIKELVHIFVTTPDVIEEFYQLATNGLDNSVQRRKLSQAIGVDLRYFMPSENFQAPATIPQIAGTATGESRLDLKTYRVLPYSKPQGQVSKS